MEPKIIAQTDRWIVLDKPAGWLTIPGRSARSQSSSPVLLDWLRVRHSSSRQAVQVVHRLDRETSGVILFALGPEAHREAGLWFQRREIKKTYVCLAQGRPLRPVLKIQKPIEGAPSTTQVEVKERFADAFFAHLRPLTGRRHQIRIHLAGEGHPLLGDRAYGGPGSLVLASTQGLAQGLAQGLKDTLEIPRVALHAMRLELPSGDKFEAALPLDFESWLGALRACHK